MEPPDKQIVIRHMNSWQSLTSVQSVAQIKNFAIVGKDSVTFEA